MKEMVKIVLITAPIALLAIAGVGMYVKTALPTPGPASELVTERTVRIENDRYQESKACVSIECNSTGNLSKIAGPKVEGANMDIINLKVERKHDFPLNFIFNVIPVDENIEEPNDKNDSETRKYLAAGML